MNDLELKSILEALLISYGRPLSLDKLLSAFDEVDRPTEKQILTALELLSQDYETRAMEIKKTASGYCLQTKMHFSPWITRLLVEKPAKYTHAFLEVLAIIAYKQPVTRADIEDIRGVGVSSSMLKALLEREWIEVSGHRDLPGKPAVYVTTQTFLDYFNLVSLDDLPSLER